MSAVRFCSMFLHGSPLDQPWVAGVVLQTGQEEELCSDTRLPHLFSHLAARQKWWRQPWQYLQHFKFKLLRPDSAPLTLCLANGWSMSRQDFATQLLIMGWPRSGGTSQQWKWQEPCCRWHKTYALSLCGSCCRHIWLGTSACHLLSQRSHCMYPVISRLVSSNDSSKQ